MKYTFSILPFLIFSFNINAQIDLSKKLEKYTSKGDYAIIEVRLNKEDEFRTMEGSNSSLARIAVYTGNNQGQELISKEFEGINDVVSILNKLKKNKNKWRLINVYPIKGESLIITHYVIERRR